MLYRIVDIIADRDPKAVGRLVVVLMASLLAVALLGWLVMAF